MKSETGCDEFSDEYLIRIFSALPQVSNVQIIHPADCQCKKCRESKEANETP